MSDTADTLSASTSQTTNNQATSTINIGREERLLSTIGGAGLLAFGLSDRSRPAWWLATAGGVVLLYRGLTGHCPAVEAMSANHANQSGTKNMAVPHHQGVLVERAITIQQPAEKLYTFWHDLTHLPRFMDHVESVWDLGNGRTHWRVKGPAGTHVEWDAEIINDEPNRLIAWKSLANTDVNHAGSIRFTPVSGGDATEVKLTLNYAPPAGVVGMAIAKLFGEEPAIQAESALQRFRQLMETGEIPTVEGQPKGR